MERVPSIPLTARIYLERQILAGSREARFLRGAYRHPLGRGLSFENALETGVAVFRGRIASEGADSWTVHLDDPPDAISALFAQGLQIGLRAEDGPMLFLTQTDALGATVDGDIVLLPPAEIVRLVMRRYARKEIDLRLDIAGVRCRTLNLAGSGVLAVCPNTLALHVGEIIQVILHLPSDPPAAATARVMRAGRDPFGSTTLALMFIQILATDRDRIVDLVASQSLPSPETR